MKIIIVIAVAFAVLRIYLGTVIPPESFVWFNFFKDMAHVFIGGLGVLWWNEDNVRRRGHLGMVFWGLNAVEVLVAIVTRI